MSSRNKQLAFIVFKLLMIKDLMPGSYSMLEEVNKKTGEVNMDENKEVVSGGELYFPQENVYHSTLPSKDTKNDTRLGMSCQVAKKLLTAFEKYRCGSHPSHFKVKDGKSIS
ncbi:hypothetical protein BY996DRAFT_6492256 [Phakopsora pachyrhizi]|nr:hypothetical protein BY996DRAFT_6492256 [Phakopsora pachyrhizi]